MDVTVETAVMEAIAKQKQIDVGLIERSSRLEDLGISSLDAITIIYELEDLFDVEVPNEKLDSLQTVGEIIEGIDRLQNG